MPQRGQFVRDGESGNPQFEHLIHPVSRRRTPWRATWGGNAVSPICKVFDLEGKCNYQELQSEPTGLKVKVIPVSDSIMTNTPLYRITKTLTIYK